MKLPLRSLPALLALALLVACVPPQPFPSDPSGELFFPADNGARVDVMPADCLVTGNPCPAPITLSLYPEEWNVIGLDWAADASTAAVLAADEPKDHLALFSPPSRQLRRFASLAFVRETAWSPDGKQLAVAGVAEQGQKNAATNEGQMEGSNILLYSVAGKELGNLTAGMPGRKSNLGWLSADTLLFQNFLSEQDCNVYTVTVGSGSTAPWTEPQLCHANPAISPDGAQVAFVRDGNLYLADGDGSDATLILDLPASIDRPAWSPDGQWIAFDETEPSAIGVVHPDGTGYRQVGESGENTGFAPLPDKALLLARTVHGQDASNATASWFVIPIPDGQPAAVVVPGIPPDQMPLNLSWRPPQQ
ncbi:MAG: PD40 domain-containing protein [Anaerolineae bacterium]|nr:PD40 domain-containing protein [Anaerolineae bacterium]